MTIIEAMAKTINEAKFSGRLCYLHTSGDDYYVSSQYQKDWLFMAYPGGRKILSTEGNQLVQEASGK